MAWIYLAATAESRSPCATGSDQSLTVKSSDTLREFFLSRMAEGALCNAPIWDDIRTLAGREFRAPIDIIYGGFPCQDISVAGLGKGLAGERSGLVFEVFRLIREIQPTFVFLENVPAIRTRGAERVVKELAALGYDCRWDCLSAFDVGAPHKRERWFLLAYRNGDRRERVEKRDSQEPKGARSLRGDIDGLRDTLANTSGVRREQGRAEPAKFEGRPHAFLCSVQGGCRPNWWEVEPDVGRVANGVTCRVDRLRALGNGVVPQQVKEAFERLMGVKREAIPRVGSSGK